MRKIRYILLLCWLAVMPAGISCTFTPDTDKDPDGEVVLRVPVSRGGDEAENVIANARLMIFSGTGSRSVIKNLYQSDNITFEELVPCGKLSIYLIANERAEWDLGNVTSVYEMKEKLTNLSAYPVVSTDNPIPMAGIYEDVYLALDGTVTKNGAEINLSSAMGTVKRLYAKVTLYLNCTYNTLAARERHVLESVSVCSLPKEYYLLPRSYQGAAQSDYFSGPQMALIPGIDYSNRDMYGNDGFYGEFSFYIPEHIASDVTKASYLYFVTHIYDEGSTATKRYFKLKIGNGIPNGMSYMDRAGVTTEDLTINRNKHYIFRVTNLRNDGQTEAEVFPSVEDWTPVGVDGNTKERKLTVSMTEINMTNNYSTVRVYFSSNQPDVRIGEKLNFTITTYNYWSAVEETSATTRDNTQRFFEKLTGSDTSNFHYTYDEATKTGTGYFDLSYSPQLTLEMGSRYNHYVELQAGEDLTRTVLVKNNIPQSWKKVPCVGTFHRKSEYGERIIYSGHNGAWSASVILGADFIRLSADRSADDLLGTSTPRNAEDFPVTGSLTSVSGTGNIFFRVGLTGTTSSNRYGAIRVVWNDNGTQRTSVMYVRQGEDPVQIDGTGTYWATYNVDDAFTFTDYPTMIGKVFQYGRVQGFSVASDEMPAGWNPGDRYLSEGFQESACPDGYRHPFGYDDGWNHTTNQVDKTMRGSEFTAIGIWYQESLQKDKFIYGFYADGYYDRYSHNVAGTVNDYTDRIAMRGMLIGGNGGGSATPTFFLPATIGRGKDGMAYGRQGLYSYYAVNTDYLTTGFDDAVFAGFAANINATTPTLQGRHFGEGYNGSAPKGWSLRCVKKIIGS